MVLNIDNACYGKLKLVAPTDKSNWYTISGDNRNVPFELNESEVLFSSELMGKLYTGHVTAIDCETNSLVLDNEIVLSVSNYQYFARLY